MKKFAQIVDNKVNWIFEAEEKPQFAPNIILIDITDRIDIKEGWFYNKDTKTFSEIDLNPVVIKEPVDAEKVAMAEAIIDLNLQMDDLRTQINKLTGGK